MEKNYDKAFSIGLDYILKERGRGSEVTLSIDSGISQPSINNIRQGKVIGRITTLRKLAKALHTDFEDVLSIGKMIIDGKGFKISEKQSEYRRNTNDSVSDELSKVIDDIKIIYETGDQVVIEALKHNIEAFKKGSLLSLRLMRLEAENQKLWDAIKKVEKTNKNNNS